MSLISLHNVSYQYPLTNEFAIKDVNIEIDQGKIYGIIGPNQSGKTTLCNILRGFIPSIFMGNLSGEVLFEGKPLKDKNIGELAEYIGYSSQNPFTQISGVKDTVEEEIAFGMENMGLDYATMHQRVTEILEMFQLEDLKERNPFELSGGQKQRVALASVIALNLEIIILDEPTSQLDPKGTEDVFNVVASLKKQGKTVVIVEHKIDLLAEYCDEIIVVKDHTVLLKGDCRYVFTNSLMRANNLPIPKVTEFYLQHATEKLPLTLREVQSWKESEENDIRTKEC